MKKIQNKHSAAELTIFSKMTALAQQHQAINLSQGFPDFPIDERLSQLLSESTQKGFNQYAPSPGLSILREAIAEDFSKRHQLFIDPEFEITISPGATYGLYVALATILEPGDEVLVLEPAYDSYIPNIEMLGGRVVTVELTSNTFLIDWEKMKNAVTPKTKAIVINVPHNPSGTLWPLEEWNRLAQFSEEHDLYVISDEVYESLVFDGKKHQSVLHHPLLRERSFAVFSFGKVFQQTGWKVGYTIASKTLTQAYRKIHQYLAFSVNSVSQYALAKYLETEDSPAMNQIIQLKRDYFLKLISDLPFTVQTPAMGGYFQLLGYEKISTEKDTVFSEKLTTDAKLASIPVSAFYQSRKNENLLRFCFAKSNQTLEAAAKNLQSFFHKKS